MGVMQAEPVIFISYRRRDAGGHARALHEYLSKRFGGERIFFDQSSIESGDVFPDTLRQGIRQCAVLLALIGPEWLDVRGDDGRRRLDDPNDFVRREIALALEQGKKVIPVLFDDTPMPARDRLPDPLKALANRNAQMLRGKSTEFYSGRRDLVRSLSKVPGVPQPLPEPEADLNRQRMLAKVRRDWIDGYLKHSLENVARIELGLEEKPDAVSRPWDLVVQQPDRTPRPLPPGQSMAAIFDELGPTLLILGAPGSGKTTLLLELARDLLDRAVQNATHPIPVVVLLSSWAARQRPLADWLVDELAQLYDEPREVVRAWVEADQILPLLDGLDEVAPENREGCVEAINAFRHRHPLVRLAVCSRAADHEMLRVRLELSGAITIRPLSRAQASNYLKQAGKKLAELRAALRDDETLWELLDTPLMLSIFALAYQGRSAAEVRELELRSLQEWRSHRGRLPTQVRAGSLEQRRAHLFENYTRSMFERRSPVTAYTREQTLRWLTWLAESLKSNNLSVFYLEWMQPDWLPRAQRWIVPSVPFMAWGLVSGLAVGLINGLVSWLAYGPEKGLKDGLFMGRIGLGFGLIVTLFGVLSYALGAKELASIKPIENIKWSSKKARSYFYLWSGIGLGCLALTYNLNGKLALLPATFLLALGTFLAHRLIFALTADPIVTPTIPNEGIRRSLRHALISSTIPVLIGVVVGLGWGRASPFDSLRRLGITVYTLLPFLLSGLTLGMRNGGVAYLQHYALRLVLWGNGYAPLNYTRFLDYAAERVFVRKVGGGYIFTHRLLMEYFATLQPTDQAPQIQAA